MAAAAAAGAGADAYTYSMQHPCLPFPVQAKAVRDVITVDLDWSNMPTLVDRGRDTRHEFGLGEEKRHFRVDFAVGATSGKLAVQLKVHESLMERCTGIHWSLPEFMDEYASISFTHNTTPRDSKQPEWYYGLVDNFEPKRSVRQMRVVILTFFPQPDEIGTDDRAYMKQVSDGLFGARQRGTALVMTSDGKQIKVDKNMMKATGYTPLSAPFWDMAFHTARLARPEVTWDLTHDAALLVVEAIYRGPNRTWANAPASDANVDTWMAILAFVQSRLMTAFVEPATQMVKRCISARVYAKVLMSATLHGWTDIKTALEVHATRDMAAVLASFAGRDTNSAAAAAMCRELPPPQEVSSHRALQRDTNVHAFIVSGIRVELAENKLVADRWEMSPVYDMPGAPEAKFRIMFQRFRVDDADIRVVFAFRMRNNDAHIITFWVPEFEAKWEHPTAFSPTGYASEPFDMVKACDGAALGSDWRYVRVCVNKSVARPREVSMRVTVHYKRRPAAAAASASTEDDRLHHTECIQLAMAKNSEHVDVALLSSKAESKDKDIVAAFAHSVILAAHSQELAQTLRDAPLPSLSPAAAAATKAPEAVVLDRCREVRLDATPGAIVLLRNALYCGGELSLSSGVVTLVDVMDLIAVCARLNPAAKSVALNRTESLARVAFTKRITGSTLVELLEMTKLPKYTTLRALVEDHVKSNPDMLTVLLYSNGSKAHTAVSERGPTQVTADSRAAKKQRLDAPASAAASAARSLEDENDDTDA